MERFQGKYRIDTCRLKHWDYSAQGYYFVTVCTDKKAKLCGEIMEYQMNLNNTGESIKRIWNMIPDYFPSVILDEYVVMPDHFHGIIRITKQNDCKDEIICSDKDAMNRVSTFKSRGGITGTKNPILLENSLGKIMRWFKGRCTFEINKMQTDYVFRWQRSYYERIIRSERELVNIRNYIKNNPWGEK